VGILGDETGQPVGAGLATARGIAGDYRRILVGIDGSENGSRALDRAIELAKSSGSKLTAAVIVDNMRYSSYPSPGLRRQFDQRAKTSAQKIAASAKERARAAGLEILSMDKNGHPAEKLLSLASEQRADLIIVGRRGVTGLRRFLMGSVSTAVIDHATCDVLVVK
jgi:nucleotide-binding universal stress UspA family protein